MCDTCAYSKDPLRVLRLDRGSLTKVQGLVCYGYGILNNAGVLFYCYASDSMFQVWPSNGAFKQ